MKPEQVNELIRTRRAIYPKSYIKKSIPKEIIEEILENANHAPTHKMTRPWKFRVHRKEGISQISALVGAAYKKYSDKFLKGKLDKMMGKFDQSDCVIAIFLDRSTSVDIPEWEEIAAVACAVQNMWLTCSAYGIGCYWSSPRFLVNNPTFDVPSNEKCLGLFYMGYADKVAFPTSRKSMENKVVWIT
jgi:nitroreductase